jgi:hypothetical protein
MAIKNSLLGFLVESMRPQPVAAYLTSPSTGEAVEPSAVGGTKAPVTDTISTTPIAANATAVQVVAANPARKTLTLINDGTGDAYYGYASTVTAATGMPLYANGGGKEWGLGETDPRAVYVFSVPGTTVRVSEGV